MVNMDSQHLLRDKYSGPDWWVFKASFMPANVLLCEYLDGLGFPIVILFSQHI